MLSHHDSLPRWDSMHPDKYSIQLPHLNQHQAHGLHSALWIWGLDFGCPLPLPLTGSCSPQPPPPTPCWPTMLRTDLAWPRPGQGSGRSQGGRELTGCPDGPAPFWAKALGLDSQLRTAEVPHTVGCSCSPRPLPQLCVLNSFPRCS